MPRFKVGDTVWNAKCRWEQIQVVCPTCFGKKEVTLILGNDERVILPCDGCGKGYDGPKGYVTKYNYVVEPETVNITGIEIEIDGTKEVARYRNGSYSFDEADLSPTREEAYQRAHHKRLLLEEDQRTRADLIKKLTHKNFSWNANYHMRQAKDLRKQAEYHDEKAKLCKERAKNKGVE